MRPTIEGRGDGTERRPAPLVRLRLLTLAVLGVAAAAWSGVDLDRPGIVSPVLVLPILLTLYVVVESAQLHPEVRRQTYSVSLSELPLVVGLFLTTPVLLLASRLVGYAIVAAVRRMAPDKAAFNVAVFSAEVGVAAATFQAVGAGVGGLGVDAGLAAGAATAVAGDPSSPQAWAAAYLAALAAVLVGCFAVGAAIAVLQPPLGGRQFLDMVLPTLVTAALTTTLGLLVVVLVETTAWTVLGIALVGAVLVVAYSRFGRLVREHKDLGELYELTREVSTSLRDAGLDGAVLERVRRLMRAEVAQLWLTDGNQLVTKAADADPVTREAPADRIRSLVLAGESVLAGPWTRDPTIQAALDRRAVQELVAVPIRVAGEVAGSLEVLDRQGDRSRFVPPDRTLLETLAVHTGVALENARLVGRLRHEAQHDPLTGLPNRRAFLDRLDAALAELPSGLLLAVLVLDLQSFKDVNDTLGRAAGDRLLAEVARRIQAAANDPECVARLSSDEIAVFTPVADLEAAREAAGLLQAVLSTPVLVTGIEVDVGAVVGIAVYPEHGTESVTLLQRADIAMYAAKRTSRGILTYAPSMDAPSVRRFGLVGELRRAIDAKNLLVWYQPQVRLDRSELVGLEALVRWQHPEHGLIPPDEFIPVAEHTGLIGSLTTFVLHRSLADLRQWRARGHEFGVSVNISVRSLLDPGFADEVHAALAEADIPPALLTLEITETGVMSDPERAVPVLEHLRAMGVRLSVDDFGIGQSSLTYLRRLPVAEVKIDRSFVLDMVNDAGDLGIVRAVIDLSRPLGLTVVAEGVESEETRHHLAQLGCSVIQGYLLSRPLPRAEMDGWLERRTVAVPVDVSGLPEPAGAQRWLRVLTG